MTGRILLVGEPGDELTELKMSLQSMGLVVEVARDGMAALEIGKAFQPDLVISEILTNRLSGFEISARIMSGLAGFSAPVMFYTEFYRDEKARREVLSKYGALLYFVKPFQKEALKKAVSVHFQDFLKTNQPENTEPPGSVVSEVTQPPPPLSRATAAKEGTSTVSLASVVPPAVSGNQSTAPKREIPVNRFSVFNTDAKAIDSAVAKALPVADATIETASHRSSGSNESGVNKHVLETENPQKPRANSAESRVILASKQESMLSHVFQSSRFQIGIALVLVAVAFYFVRGQLPNSPERMTSTVGIQVNEKPQGSTPALGPTVELPSPVSSLSTTSTSPTETPNLSIAEAPASPTAGLEVRRRSQDETSSGDSSSRISISDVTGRGKGPYVRRMKGIQLPAEGLGGLENTTVVVRIIVDETGKVQEVTPLNRGETKLPPSFVSSIQEWQFSRLRGDQTTAVKYYSFRFGKNRRR